MVENAGVTREKKRPWTGLVLSGGGARGAYEAGVSVFAHPIAA